MSWRSKHADVLASPFLFGDDCRVNDADGWAVEVRVCASVSPLVLPHLCTLDSYLRAVLMLRTGTKSYTDLRKEKAAPYAGSRLALSPSAEIHAPACCRSPSLACRVPHGCG